MTSATQCRPRHLAPLSTLQALHEAHFARSESAEGAATCGSRAADRGGVLEADILAMVLKLLVVVDAQLEELAVLAISGAERVVRVRVRRVVLRRCQ